MLIMKDSQYINIQGWMGTRLGLRANDLICFAVIYGFSMDGESQFKGNLNYLAACMFVTQPTVILALNHLLKCNLILKQDDVVKGRKRCYYSTNVIYNEGKFEVIDTTKKPLVMTTKEPLVMTTKESLPKEYNNKEYNDNNKKLSNDNKSERLSITLDDLKAAFPDFDDFWQKYRKGGKQAALKAWKKLKHKDMVTAYNTVDDYLLFCKRSNRPIKDVSTYLNQKCFLDDYASMIPEAYQPNEKDEKRVKDFKKYMIDNFPDIIYHRHPLTFEQANELMVTWGVNQFEWAVRKLSERDIHQYYSIKKGLDEILNDDNQVQI